MSHRQGRKEPFASFATKICRQPCVPRSPRDPVVPHHLLCHGVIPMFLGSDIRMAVCPCTGLLKWSRFGKLEERRERESGWCQSATSQKRGMPLEVRGKREEVIGGSCFSTEQDGRETEIYFNLHLQCEPFVQKVSPFKCIPTTPRQQESFCMFPHPFLPKPGRPESRNGNAVTT